MVTSNKLSFLTDRVIPRHVREDHPTFQVFIKSYFEYLEREMGEYDSVANLLLYRDIDTTIDSFIDEFRKERAPNLPLNANVNLRNLIKNIRKFYSIKGTEAGYTFLFKIIFDETVTFSYPKIDVLRTSDITTVLDGNDKLLDSWLWQDFSYVIHHSATASSFFQKLLVDIVHPAGLKLFSELSLDAAQLSMIVSHVESQILLIFLTLIDAIGFTFVSSDITSKMIAFSRTSGIGHSTGWLVQNKENYDVIARTGLNTIEDWDEVTLRTMEGQDGHALSMVFRDGLKDYMGNITVVDNTLTSTVAATPGEVITLVTLPHQKVNFADFQISDGSFTSTSIRYVGVDKSKLFVFVAGKKLRPTQYNLPTPNVLNFVITPANTEAVEWYVMEHESETTTTVGAQLNYALSFIDVSTSHDTIQVFLNGLFKNRGVDYRINSITNEIILFVDPGTNAKIEVVKFPAPQLETFLIPAIENFATVDAQLDYTLINPPVGQEALSVFLDGAIQRKGVDYTFATPIVTLAVNPGTGKSLDNYIIAKTIGREDRTLIGYNTQTNFWLDEYVDMYTPVRNAIVERLVWHEDIWQYLGLNAGNLSWPDTKTAVFTQMVSSEGLETIDATGILGSEGRIIEIDFVSAAVGHLDNNVQINVITTDANGLGQALIFNNIGTDLGGGFWLQTVSLDFVGVTGNIRQIYGHMNFNYFAVEIRDVRIV